MSEELDPFYLALAIIEQRYFPRIPTFDQWTNEVLEEVIHIKAQRRAFARAGVSYIIEEEP